MSQGTTLKHNWSAKSKKHLKITSNVKDESLPGLEACAYSPNTQETKSEIYVFEVGLA